MEQQSTREFKEFYDWNVGEALQYLEEKLVCGGGICFVGLRSLAETLVEAAQEKGLNIEADFQQGFGEHVLTLVGRKDCEQPLVVLEEPVSTWRTWFRLALLSSLYGIIDAVRSR